MKILRILFSLRTLAFLCLFFGTMLLIISIDEYAETMPFALKLFSVTLAGLVLIVNGSHILLRIRKE